jgi:hypothetical protein
VGVLLSAAFSALHLTTSGLLAYSRSLIQLSRDAYAMSWHDEKDTGDEKKTGTYCRTRG